MEYLIGSLLTLFGMIVFSRTIRAVHTRTVPIPIKYSQAYVHTLLSPMMPYLVPLAKKVESQSSKHSRENQVRIIFTEKEAYWIANSKLYMAELIDGMVDEESTKLVDTMGMDKVQLDKMVFIVEKLTEGLTNDNRNSGN
jgi:hypothetical protein